MGDKKELFEEALALHRQGRASRRKLLTVNRLTLLELQKLGVVERVEILGCQDSCPACAALSGRVMTIAEALDQEPIPPPGCTHVLDKRPGWCRCEYVADL